MNIFEEYELEIATRERAKIAQEQAEWEAMTPDQRAEFWRLRDQARQAEDERQKRIARQHLEMFGPDDPDESKDE